MRLAGWLAGWLAGFPICELLIKLATFWLGATRSLFSGFVALQKSGLPICELLIKLAAVGERPTYIHKGVGTGSDWVGTGSELGRNSRSELWVGTGSELGRNSGSVLFGTLHSGSPRGLPLGFHKEICGEPPWS